MDVTLAAPADVDSAVARARDALPAWRALAPARRARLLNRLADLLEADRADAATIDNGTPVTGSAGLSLPTTSVHSGAQQKDEDVDNPSGTTAR